MRWIRRASCVWRCPRIPRGMSKTSGPIECVSQPPASWFLAASWGSLAAHSVQTIPPGASGTWAGDSDQSISLLPGLCKTISARYGGGECKSSLFALAQWVWPIILLHGAADIQVHRGWKQRILGSHRSTSNFNGFATLLRYACVCAKFSGSSAVCPAFSKALLCWKYH